VPVLVEDEELGVIAEALAHRVEVVGEATEIDAGVHRLAVDLRNAVEVLGDFIGAGEHPQIVAQLFGPQIDFAGRLRADAQQLFRRLRLQRALVFDVGNPHGRQRRNQRRDDTEHEHLGADAGEPASLFHGAHKIHADDIIASQVA
jgi:hypothetical protein